MYNKEAQKRYYEKNRKKIIKRQTEWDYGKGYEYYKDYQREYQREYQTNYRVVLYFREQNGHTDKSKRP